MPAAVRLTESRTTSAGTLIAAYVFEGRPSYEAFTFEDENVTAD